MAMFDDLTTSQRNQHFEVCRYFFRSAVLKKHLDELVEKYGNVEKAVLAEWDEFWCYYSFWLSGLWVACEGIERIGFGDEEIIAEAKRGMSLLHPIRQATFHFKPNTAQMMRHFENHELALTSAWALHENIKTVVGEFLVSLPDEYLDGLDEK